MRKITGMATTNSELEYELDINNVFDFYEGGPRLLLDTDPVAYAAANVCDTTTYTIRMNGRIMNEIEGGITEVYDAFSVKNKKEWEDLLDTNPNLTIEKEVTPDADPAAMFHTIKAQIKRAIKETKAGSVTLFLTDGDSNFRLTEEIATVLKYKGNRSKDNKPILLGEARDYIMNKLTGDMCIGIEADDKLSIIHRKEWARAFSEASKVAPKGSGLDEIEKIAMDLTKTVLGSIDKDLKMCPGKYYNPDAGLGIEEIYPLGHLHLDIKEYPMTGKIKSKDLKFNGLKGFYAQILLGDSADNIPGVFQCGDVATYEILKDCKNEKELFKATLREIYEGFHREHILSLSGDIDERIQCEIDLGAKDSKSSRTKLKSKHKSFLTSNVAYCCKPYYPWQCYQENEDGTVSKELHFGITEESSCQISPVQFMTEVARLLYMLDTYPDEEGSHLWTPNSSWVTEVHEEYLEKNLKRIPMRWGP